MLDSPTPDRNATILLLLAIAGCVDVVGLGETGRYFVSYMSGNTTELGQLLAYHDYAGALVPIGLVALFVGGATLGTLVVEASGRRSAGALLLVEALLLATAWWGLGSPRPMLGVILLPVAMGLANIVTLHEGGASPGTTYATGTLVKLGVALAGLGRDHRLPDVLRYATMWLALLVGGMLGAIGQLRWGPKVLLVPVAALALLGLVDLVLTRRRQG
jgi:uncharacterized membrane protein YoaK (UPF0700 family)